MKQEPLREAIRRIVRENRTKQGTIAGRAGISENTMTTYLRDTGKVRLHFLREIDRLYGLSDEEIVDIVRRRG